METRRVPPPAENLKRLLDLCDRMEGLRDRIRSLSVGREFMEATIELERSRREMRDALREAGSGQGPMAELARRHHLNQMELLATVFLLRHRILHRSSSLSGRRILSSIFQGTFSVLSGTRLLGQDSRLLKSGMVVIQTRSPRGDVLNTRYKLANSVYRSVVEEFAATPGNGSSDGLQEATGYPASLDLLLDLYRLANLCQRRGSILFDFEAPSQRRRTELPGVRRRIASYRQRIARRLEASAKTNLPWVERFFTEQGLEEPERLVVSVLFFQEVFYGTPALPIVELVRMMSDSPRTFLANRSRLSREGRLVRQGLAQIESEESERDGIGEIGLAPWFSRQVFAESGGAPPIDPGSREKFRRYLDGLEDSSQFFSDLDRG
jgi:hypothetical protein